MMKTLLVVFLVCFLSSLCLPSTEGADVVVYDDVLKNGWQDWSWGTHSLAATGPPTPQAGTKEISYTPNAWDAIYFHASTPLDVASYPTFEFYVNGGSTGGQLISLSINPNGSPKATVSLTSIAPNHALTANTWQKVSVTFASLGITSGQISEFWFQDASGRAQSTFFVDSIVIRGGSTPPSQLTVTVDTTKNVRAISQNIYGVNFATPSQFAAVKYPVNRNGGNAATLYNWQQSISNKGSDWYFQNIPDSVANPSALPEGSATDVFVDQSRAASSAPILTASLIGYTPVDQRAKKWSYSVAKYGAQTGTECTGTNYATWCTADSGNGISSATNQKITSNAKTDCYKTIDSTYVQKWMDHLTARNTPVTLWQLDNEPGLWHEGHFDVHPKPVTYDEMWSRTTSIASAIKAKNANSKTIGPSAWGWCEYWYSAADGCDVGADRQAHSNLSWLDWYAQQVCAYKTAHGVQLVDYLDVHFYPQGNGVSLSSQEDADTAARRLRSVKALYDPNYVDESWIGQVVNLIPKLRTIVSTRCSSLKISITEYNFGNDDIITSAIATAEALAIFGREGVSLATRWVAPDVGTKVENAFKLYLNYDGAGNKVTGSSVSAISSNVDKIGAYAIFNSGGKKLFLLFFNKATSATTVSVTLASFPTLTTTTGKLYQFTKTQNLHLVSSAVGVTNGAITLSNLPAWSASLVVISTP